MPSNSSTLAPLKHETYRRIWFASLASNFGGLIQAARETGNPKKKAPPGGDAFFVLVAGTGFEPATSGL